MTAPEDLRSRVTKKGQITVPVKLRREFQLAAGKNVSFESSRQGIIIKPVHDIIDSAGALAKFAGRDAVEKDLIESRKKPFR
jgi:AbrB family looped-hinge helix DNA binding protein